MSHYDQFINALHQFPSKTWINKYFDLQRRLFEELSLSNDDPRLAMSLPSGNKMPVNLGQRYILQPFTKHRIGCIVPADFEEEAIGGKCNFVFTRNRVADAKWIVLPFDTGNTLPNIAWNACLLCCEDILQQSRRSGYRKYHVPLLYDFTMENAARHEVLSEVRIEE